MKRRNSLLLMILFCHLLSQAASVTCQLSGIIKEPSGEPVYFATISVRPSGQAVAADADGLFEMKLTRGRYDGTVSSIGYKPYSFSLQLERDTTLEIIMQPEALMLEGVTAYGKTLTQRMKEGEFAVNSLDVSGMANTTQSLADLVGRTSGVRIRTEGGVGSDFDVSINGLTGSAIRYFIDGVPMETRGADFNLGNLPLNQIARVDVYKGVVPAFLGTDAMGGAVNIITNNNRKRYIDASVSAGSFGTYSADFSALAIETRSGLKIRPSFAYNYSKNNYMMKGVEVWDKEEDRYVTVNRRRFHDSYRSIQGGIELRIDDKKWAKRLSVAGTYNNLEKEIQTGSVQAIVYGQPRRKAQAWSFEAHYAKDSLLLPHLNLFADFSYTADHSQTVDTVFRKYDWNGNWIPSQRNEINGGAKSIRHYKRPLFTGRVNVDYLLAEGHTLNLNYSVNHRGNKRYDDLDIEYEPAKDILTKHITSLTYRQNLLGGRLQTNIFGKLYLEKLRIVKVSDRWNDDAADNKTKGYPGYGIGMRFNITEWLQAKWSAEHAVRLPLSRELLGNGTTVTANMSLKPESSGNLNLGVFGNINAGGGHRFYYEVGAYIRAVRDMIHLVTNENTGLSAYSNIAKVSVKGIEGELGYHYEDKMHFSTNWSYSVSRDMNAKRSDGKPSVTYRNRIPNKPWLYGNVDLTYIFSRLARKDDRLRVGYTMQYVHWFYLTWEGYGSLSSKSKIPDQWDQSLYVTYSWMNERFNITGEVNNIFDRTLYDNYKLQKPGRSLMVKFRLFIG